MVACPVGRRGWLPGSRVPDDGDRAGRVAHAVRADRAKHHAFEPAVPAVADDKQVGDLRLVDERLRRMPVDDPALDLQCRLVASSPRARLVEYLLTRLR